MFAVDRGRPQRSYQYNWLHCVLPEVLPEDEALKVKMKVLAKFPKGSTLKLQLHFENLRPVDVVAVKINGKAIEGLKSEQENLLEA